MKQLITMVGATALALLTTSCFQQETTLSLNKDGSGTITETTILGAQMLAMMGATSDEGGDPLDQMIAQAKVKSDQAIANMGEGVTLMEIRKLNQGGKKGLITVYQFKDINKLKYTFGSSLADDEAGEDKEPLDISYKNGVLTINNKHEKAKEGEQPAKPEMGDQQLAMAQQMMGDMRMALKLEFPGGIADTNARHQDGNKVTMMDIDFGKLMAQEEIFKEFMKGQPESPAEAAQLLNGVDGVKIETAEKITVKLK